MNNEQFIHDFSTFSYPSINFGTGSQIHNDGARALNRTLKLEPEMELANFRPAPTFIDFYMSKLVFSMRFCCFSCFSSGLQWWGVSAHKILIWRYCKYSDKKVQAAFSGQPRFPRHTLLIMSLGTVLQIAISGKDLSGENYYVSDALLFCPAIASWSLLC